MIFFIDAISKKLKMLKKSYHYMIFYFFLYTLNAINKKLKKKLSTIINGI